MSDIAANKKFWKTHAQKYDFTIKILNRKMPVIGETIEAYIEPNHSVLEIASGTGLITNNLLKAKVLIASDFSDEMIEILSSRYAGNKHVTIKRINAYSIDQKNQSFDVIVCANLLHLLDDPQRALEEFKRVLRSNGLLIVPTFCHGENLRAITVSKLLAKFRFPIVHRYSKSTLQKVVEDSGFKVRSNELYNGLLPIALVVAVK